MRRKSRVIGESEVDSLRYSLRLSNSPKGIKSALQAICVHYEANRFLENTADVRQLIHSHLGSEETLLRRWSLKALGLIADPDDAPRIVDRLRVEQDQEAQTWGTAALLGSSPDQSLSELVSRSQLDSSTPLILAARLYAHDSWLRRNYQPVSVSLDDDDLTLKWALFLSGYNRAPPDLFSQQHDLSNFLAALNEHDTPEIAEYSVWALYERPEYGPQNLRLPIHEFGKQPDNVRKWLYRVIMKAPSTIPLDGDLLYELSLDRSTSAREGLAQGIADLRDGTFDEPILRWFTREKQQPVKEHLLLSMAKREMLGPDFKDIIVKRFKDEAPDSSLRRKLLAASELTPLHPTLKRLDTIDRLEKQGLAQFGLGFDQQTIGGIHIVNNSLTVHGNLNAQNVSAGDMIGSANGAVQNIQSNRSTDREVLSHVIEFLKTASITEHHKNVVAEKVKVVAESPTTENKESLLASLKQIADVASITGTVVEGAEKIVAAVGGWIS